MLKYTLITFGSFLIILLLFVIYKSKPRYSSIENKLYKFILNLLICCMFIELLSYVTMYYRESIPIINELVCRLAYTLAISFSVFAGFYFLSIGWNYKVDKIRDLLKVHWKFKLLYYCYFITLIIYFALPFEYYHMGTYAYLSGPACYFIYISGLIMMIIIGISTLINKQNMDSKKKIQIYFTFIMSFITIPLQLIFPNIPLLTSGFCINMYILYFSLENPDLMLMDELKEARRLTDESSNAKGDFLSNMSHEIRSPMNAIIGFSESILNSESFNEDDIRKDLSNISSAGTGLLDIINNILDISKIENGKETLHEMEYSIKDITLELVSIIEARIGNKNIKLITEIDENLPSVLYGDKTKIYQILLNLLTNAVKYTEVGKIFLRINGEIIDNHILLNISVEDTGFGIKKEDSDKLFNKFVRLDSAIDNDIEGTGLGLVITKKMVNLLNGEISFTSDYEVGTTFVVKIKQKIINYDKIGNLLYMTKVNKKINFLDCSNYSIMIVDNNKLNLKVIERLLSFYKFRITTVTSGYDCIYKIKEGNKYDMIFLDHMMPDMDGIEVMHILKKLEAFDIPPLVALTANAITGMREMYLKEGFDEYLSKPINSNELNRLINKYFGGNNNV